MSRHTSAFKHRRDAAMPKFCERDLFAFRPDLFYRSFVCESLTAVRGLAGSRVFLVESDAGAVEVQYGGAIIGRVQDEDAVPVRELMAEQPACCGMLEADVDDETVMGDFTVRLPRESPEGDRHD